MTTSNPSGQKLEMTTAIFKPTQQKRPENPDHDGLDQDKTEVLSVGTLDTRCGFWFFKPGSIQSCANIGAFTALYSIAGLVTSTLSTYVTSQITTLERQFGFSSQQTGLILAANDIGYLVCVLFVSYWASSLHIPRSLGIATITFGLSGIACSLPHFVYGTSVLSPGGSVEAHSLNTTDTAADLAKTTLAFGSMCSTENSTLDVCLMLAARKASQPSTLLAPEQVAQSSLVLIVLGMMLQGFGKAPRSSLTITYLDDNTEKVNTGFYMGIVATVGIMGPAVSFLMGGLFSRMYVTLQPTPLTPRHPRWIGAWWLGFLVFGSLALLVSLPLFCFPRRLPHRRGRPYSQANQAELGEKNNKEYLMTLNTQSVPNELEDPSLDAAKTDFGGKIIKNRFGLKFLLGHMKEFLRALTRLLTSPVYVCFVVSGCFLIFTIGGSSSYGPKYLERMFHLPAHTANYIIAGQALCTACVGTFLGGYLSRRLKMTTMDAMKFVIMVHSISLACQLTGFFFQCDQPDVHNTPSQGQECSKDCQCQENSYFPVCGADKRTYYSPCTAGCGQVEQGMYQNCTCIDGGTARSGTCGATCPHLYAYVAFMGLRGLFGTLSMIPKMVIFIRCVSTKDRALAIGFSTFMMSLLGWLLGPIVFGNVIDGVCSIWDISCGVRGRCLRYDNNLFRLRLHGFGGVGVFCSLLFVVVAYVYARWSGCFEEPKEGRDKNETVDQLLLGNTGNPIGEKDEQESMGERSDQMGGSKSEDADSDETGLFMRVSDTSETNNGLHRVENKSEVVGGIQSMDDNFEVADSIQKVEDKSEVAGSIQRVNDKSEVVGSIESVDDKSEVAGNILRLDDQSDEIVVPQSADGKSERVGVSLSPSVKV